MDNARIKNKKNTVYNILGVGVETLTDSERAMLEEYVHEIKPVLDRVEKVLSGNDEGSLERDSLGLLFETAAESRKEESIVFENQQLSSCEKCLFECENMAANITHIIQNHEDELEKIINSGPPLNVMSPTSLSDAIARKRVRELMVTFNVLISDRKKQLQIVNKLVVSRTITENNLELVYKLENIVQEKEKMLRNQPGALGDVPGSIKTWSKESPEFYERFHRLNSYINQIDSDLNE